jgi:hypothetical protein
MRLEIEVRDSILGPMDTLKIDADALFRAVTATGYKLLAYNLDLRTGEIVSRTLAPDEVKAGVEGPSVKPLPKMGGDLTPKKDTSLFGPASVSAKPKLFGDEGDLKKPAFGGDFWKRDDKGKPALFGEEFKRESGSKKLAEIFGGAPQPKKPDPFKDKVKDKDKEGSPAKTKADSAAPTSRIPMAADDPYYPRIPAATEETNTEWMRSFAREAGDPLLRDELLAALTSAKPALSFERALRRHLRLEQQWERYLRKQALGSAEVWLASLGVKWELVGK